MRWVPEDPAVAERDPDLIRWWLRNRVDVAALPGRPVVLDLEIRGTRAKRFWLVLGPNAEPTICNHDPCLGDDRYVYVEADANTVFPIARGLRTWTEAIADGSVQLFGEPALVRALPSWFRNDQPARAAIPDVTVAVA